MTTTYRVIWLLKDGRRKYSTNGKGQPEVWTKEETDLLKQVKPAYSKDLSIFYTQKFSAVAVGETDLIDVVGFVTEDSKTNLTEGVLL